MYFSWYNITHAFNHSQCIILIPLAIKTFVTDPDLHHVMHCREGQRKVLYWLWSFYSAPKSWKINVCILVQLLGFVWFSYLHITFKSYSVFIPGSCHAPEWITLNSFQLSFQFYIFWRKIKTIYNQNMKPNKCYWNHRTANWTNISQHRKNRSSPWAEGPKALPVCKNTTLYGVTRQQDIIEHLIFNQSTILKFIFTSKVLYLIS